MGKSPLKALIAPKMVLKPFAAFKIADRFALTPDVAALNGGPIEDVIGRLDQARRFKFPQEIAGADEIDAFADDGAPALDVGVLKKQKRPRVGVGAEKSLQRLDRGLLAKSSNRAALLSGAAGRRRYLSE